MLGVSNSTDFLVRRYAPDINKVLKSGKKLKYPNHNIITLDADYGLEQTVNYSWHL